MASMAMDQADIEGLADWLLRRSGVDDDGAIFVVTSSV